MAEEFDSMRDSMKYSKTNTNQSNCPNTIRHIFGPQAATECEPSSRSTAPANSNQISRGLSKRAKSPHKGIHSLPVPETSAGTNLFQGPQVDKRVPHSTVFVHHCHVESFRSKTSTMQCTWRRRDRICISAPASIHKPWRQHRIAALSLAPPRLFPITCRKPNKLESARQMNTLIDLSFQGAPTSAVEHAER